MERETITNLVIKVQKGDSAAADELFSAIYKDVYYFALKTVKETQLAEDITQEALIQIFCHIGELKDPVAFSAWSRQITYSQCTRYFRKTKESLVEENEDGSSIFDLQEEEREELLPDAALEKEEFRKAILSMIDSLSPQQRSAVLMYYFDSLSVTEIATIQDVSEGTVKSRLNYARRAIKEKVEDYEKKTGVRLHGIAFLPFLGRLFSAEQSALSLSSAALSSCRKLVLGKAGAAVAKGAAVGGGAKAAGGFATLSAKIAGASLGTKIAAGILAATLSIGAVYGVAEIVKTDKPMLMQKPQAYTGKTTKPHVKEHIEEENRDVILGCVTYRYSERAGEKIYDAYPSSETLDVNVDSIEILNSVNGIPVGAIAGNFAEVYPNVKHLVLRCSSFGGIQGEDQNWKSGLESLVVGKEVEYFYGNSFNDYTSLADITIEENINRTITWRMENTAFSNNEANWIVQDPWISVDGNPGEATRILICSGVVVYVDASGQSCSFPEGTLGFAENSFETGFSGCAIHIPSTAVFGVEVMGLYDEATQSEGGVSFYKEFTISPHNPVYAVVDSKIVKK